ncbi:hypothetical protein CFC21_018673, partial [Triticum aestivum]
MTMRPLVLLALAVVLAAGIGGAEGAGECSVRASAMAQQLAPCLPAVRNPQSAPTSSCCVGVRNINMRSPGCVCSVMSDVFKLAGLKPQVAIAIPKRCGIADCGG